VSTQHYRRLTENNPTKQSNRLVHGMQNQGQLNNKNGTETINSQCSIDVPTFYPAGQLQGSAD
jgi:hypothetical protein